MKKIIKEICILALITQTDTMIHAKASDVVKTLEHMRKVTDFIQYKSIYPDNLDHIVSNFLNPPSKQTANTAVSKKKNCTGTDNHSAYF